MSKSNRNFVDIYASKEGDTTSFQVPWARGIINVTSFGVMYSDESNDKIKGPKYAQFIKEYEAAFRLSHDFKLCRLGNSVMDAHCSICNLHINYPKVPSVTGYLEQSLGEKLCDLQLFHLALLKIHAEIHHEEAWTVPLDKLDIPLNLARHLTEHALVFFIMNQ